VWLYVFATLFKLAFKGQRCQLVTLCHPGLTTSRNVGITITHGAILQFFASHERHVTPIVTKFGTAEENNNPLCRAKFQVNHSIYGDFWPQNFKNPKFCKLIRHPQSIFLKFISFMRLCGLQKCFKFGVIWCLTESYRQKTAIGQISPNFSGPRAQKLRVRSEIVRGCKMGQTSSMCMQNLMEIGGCTATKDENNAAFCLYVCISVCLSHWMSRKEVRTFSNV